MNNEYQFVTRWRVRGSVDEVYEVISEAVKYPRWWPSVYLDVKEIVRGDERGLHRRIHFFTKGWLPYTLKWESEVVEVERPHRLAIRATGDFAGSGVWDLRQDGLEVEATFDWRITADKALLRWLSPVMKPVFEANHRWAMEQGRISLELEMARRHARTAEERERVPEPPGPNRTSGLWLVAGGAAVVGAILAARRAIRRS